MIVCVCACMCECSVSTRCTSAHETTKHKATNSQRLNYCTHEIKHIHTYIQTHHKQTNQTTHKIIFTTLLWIRADAAIFAHAPKQAKLRHNTDASRIATAQKTCLVGQFVRSFFIGSFGDGCVCLSSQ